MNGLTNEKREEFDMVLNAPLPGQDPTSVSAFTEEQEADSWSAAYAQFGG
ncbi:MAG TPA: hypothetical protein VIL10_01260 [Marmoricola sp.]